MRKLRLFFYGFDEIPVAYLRDFARKVSEKLECSCDLIDHQGDVLVFFPRSIIAPEDNALLEGKLDTVEDEHGTQGILAAICGMIAPVYIDHLVPSDRDVPSLTVRLSCGPTEFGTEILVREQTTV